MGYQSKVQVIEGREIKFPVSEIRFIHSFRRIRGRSRGGLH